MKIEEENMKWGAWYVFSSSNNNFGFCDRSNMLYYGGLSEWAEKRKRGDGSFLSDSDDYRNVKKEIYEEGYS